MVYTESCSDEEDETAELQRELEKIKRERAEKREQEVRPLFEQICLEHLLTITRNERRPLRKKRSENEILLLAIHSSILKQISMSSDDGTMM